MKLPHQVRLGVVAVFISLTIVSVLVTQGLHKKEEPPISSTPPTYWVNEHNSNNLVFQFVGSEGKTTAVELGLRNDGVVMWRELSR